MYKAPEERNTHSAVEMHGGGGGAAVSIEELDALVVQVRFGVEVVRVSDLYTEFGLRSAEMHRLEEEGDLYIGAALPMLQAQAHAHAGGGGGGGGGGGWGGGGAGKAKRGRGGGF